MGMGMEILWFRYIANGLGALRVILSLLLFAILVGIWLGSIAGGWLSRRFGRPAQLFSASQIGFVALSLSSLYLYDLNRPALLAGVKESLQSAAREEGLLLELQHLGLPIFGLVMPSAFLMGFAYPLANAIIQKSEAEVGRRAGLLYLGNSLGALGGSLVTGFVLLPALEMK
jgi:spermidine synthase